MVNFSLSMFAESNRPVDVKIDILYITVATTTATPCSSIYSWGSMKWILIKLRSLCVAIVTKSGDIRHLFAQSAAQLKLFKANCRVFVTLQRSIWYDVLNLGCWHKYRVIQSSQYRYFRLIGSPDSTQQQLG